MDGLCGLGVIGCRCNSYFDTFVMHSMREKYCFLKVWARLLFWLGKWRLFFFLFFFFLFVWVWLAFSDSGALITDTLRGVVDCFDRELRVF